MSLSLRQKFQQRFPKYPAAYLTTFLVLHELTAIIPLPFFYFTFQSFPKLSPHAYIPESYKTASSEFILKVKKKYFSQTEKENNEKDSLQAQETTKMMTDMITSYALVKMLMPVRIAVSLALTPWITRVLVQKFQSFSSFRLYNKSRL